MRQERQVALRLDDLNPTTDTNNTNTKTYNNTHTTLNTTLLMLQERPAALRLDDLRALWHALYRRNRNGPLERVV